MNDLIAHTPGGQLELYDPNKALENIAIAEIGERYFGRAKDARKLFQAIELKINEQANYPVWRDSQVGHGGDRKSSRRPRDLMPKADPGHDVVGRWRKRLCTKDESGKTVRDEEKIARALEDAQIRCRCICEQANTVRGTGGTGENEWFTPKEYIKSARHVLGEIDLDPATHREAQKIIQAKQFFTRADDGLTREWHGRVWLNPPYAQPLIEKFAHKLVEEVQAQRVTAAIMLTHNYTDTAWFHELASAAQAICFTRRRVTFCAPDGMVAAPVQGQSIFYFGHNVESFADVFRQFGFGVVPSWKWQPQ